jgi:peroxiredoxin Q/BCP
MICNYAEFCWTKVAGQTFYNAEGTVEGSFAGLVRTSLIIFKGGRMLRIALLLLVVVIVAVGMSRLFSSPGAAALEAGSAAPDFKLASQEGISVSLKDYRGSWVVLYFYPKDQTPGCTREAHNFQIDQPKYVEQHAVVLGVSVDNIDAHKKFCAKEGLNFKLLADTDGKVSRAYDSLTNLGVVKFSARHTFLIDPAGKVAKVYRNVDPARHSEEVLAALEQLQK